MDLNLTIVLKMKSEMAIQIVGGMMMKKTLVGVLTAVVVLSAGATSGFAACSGRWRNFVDADGNGICDYAGRTCRYIDADNDGICDNYIAGRGAGYGNGCHGGRNR